MISWARVCKVIELGRGGAGRSDLKRFEYMAEPFRFRPPSIGVFVVTFVDMIRFLIYNLPLCESQWKLLWLRVPLRGKYSSVSWL